MTADRRTRFLFIDDDELVLAAIRRTVKREPFDTFFTAEPESAFRLVKEHDIDVVFSDHSMPDMSGVEFFAILRRLHDRVHRVMMTGQSDRAITIAAINDGGVERFIEKPWSNDHLLKTMHELDVEVRAAQRQRESDSASPHAKDHVTIVRDTTGVVVIPDQDV